MGFVGSRETKFMYPCLLGRRWLHSGVSCLVASNRVTHMDRSFDEK